MVFLQLAPVGPGAGVIRRDTVETLAVGFEETQRTVSAGSEGPSSSSQRPAQPSFSVSASTCTTIWSRSPPFNASAPCCRKLSATRPRASARRAPQEGRFTSVCTPEIAQQYRGVGNLLSQVRGEVRTINGPFGTSAAGVADFGFRRVGAASEVEKARCYRRWKWVLPLHIHPPPRSSARTASRRFLGSLTLSARKRVTSAVV